MNKIRSYENGFYKLPGGTLLLKLNGLVVQMTYPHGENLKPMGDNPRVFYEFRDEDEACELLDRGTLVELVKKDFCNSLSYPLIKPINSSGDFQKGVYLSDLGHLVVVYGPDTLLTISPDLNVDTGCCRLPDEPDINYVGIFDVDKYLEVKKTSSIQAQLGVDRDGDVWLRVGDNCTILGNQFVHEGIVGVEAVTDNYNIKWAK